MINGMIREALVGITMAQHLAASADIIVNDGHEEVAAVLQKYAPMLEEFIEEMNNAGHVFIPDEN